MEPHDKDQIVLSRRTGLHLTLLRSRRRARQEAVMRARAAQTRSTSIRVSRSTWLGSSARSSSAGVVVATSAVGLIGLGMMAWSLRRHGTGTAPTRGRRNLSEVGRSGRSWRQHARTEIVVQAHQVVVAMPRAVASPSFMYTTGSPRCRRSISAGRATASECSSAYGRRSTPTGSCPRRPAAFCVRATPRRTPEPRVVDVERAAP